MKSLLPLSIAAVGIAAALSIPPATAERAVPVPAIAVFRNCRRFMCAPLPRCSPALAG